ncbi:MAG: hypothetical protein H0U66_10260 [Gemmatimonadaceae bacterium]|nr:hypothetical protein [Gemmatimonadaceae bacterium]
MTADDARTANEDLQFDRVVSSASGGASNGPPVATCVVCKKAIDSDYYHLNGKVACDSCRKAIQSQLAPPAGAGALGLAALFGIGAALAGAAVYYAVIAITNFEIGIVAILIGWMVGWGVRKGAAGKGGRRFQILAVALTYLAVGLAYAPLYYAAGTERSLLTATALIPALPIVVSVGAMPTGLISAFIIFIGLRQAWTMTAAPVLEVSGPYRIGGNASAAKV